MGFIKSHHRIKNLFFRKLCLILVIINGRLKNLQRIFFPGIYNKGIFFFLGLFNICFINDLRLRNVSKEDDYNKDILHVFIYIVQKSHGTQRFIVDFGTAKIRNKRKQKPLHFAGVNIWYLLVYEFYQFYHIRFFVEIDFIRFHKIIQIFLVY